MESLESSSPQSGAVPSPKSLVSVAQEWLYFGLLTEFLDEPVNMSLFRKSGNTGSQLLTSEYLKTLVDSRTHSLRTRTRHDGLAVVERWSDSFIDVHRTVVSKTLALASVCHHAVGEDVKDLSLTCMAISVLAEYLVDAMQKFRRSLSRTTDHMMLGRLFRRDKYQFFPIDCGLPIIQKMKEKWCLHDVEYFNGSHILHVSTLWYLANLDPPKSNMAHRNCTRTKCNAFQIDEEQYVPGHVVDGCGCANVGPDPSKLAQIIHSGGIPIVIIRDGRVQVFDQRRVHTFTTISHVWADGKGNPSGNTLPLCVVMELQRLVNELPRYGRALDVPFWIDTLCIPRDPIKLREKALLRMREPYSKASHVLVIDSYLRRNSADGASPSELLARIEVCGWSHRLWTFQEGRMPRLPARTWFAFNDRNVDLIVELKDFLDGLALSATLIEYHLLTLHNQTQVSELSGSWGLQDRVRDPVELRYSLMSRSTTRKEDEALCLGGGILQFEEDDMTELIGLSDGDRRMAMIWAKLSPISTSIAFSNAPRKLRTWGFRWAPATVMRDMELSSLDWQGPLCDSVCLPSVLSSAGLTISRPAWMIASRVITYREAILQRLSDFSRCIAKSFLILSNGNSQWFKLYLHGHWHDSPLPWNSDNHWAIILKDSRELTDISHKDDLMKGDFAFATQHTGILVSYFTDSQDMETVQVTVHRHVTIGLVSRRMRRAQNQLMGFADQLSATHTKLLEELRKRPSELEAFIRSQIIERTADLDGEAVDGRAISLITMPAMGNIQNGDQGLD
ncbi:hypothetical protein PG985_011764 [Apiospora marii]|uniref:uncharacterized protein n=1 Tax=Apiospora marii TaxID=335849 RepID=UPI00312F2045